jgi:lysozyme family protein
MNDNFSRAVEFVFNHECAWLPGHYGEPDYVTWEDVPGDAGGLTKWGIDQADHPQLDIKNLTREQAAGIYHDGEWTKCRCDDLPDGYDIAVFDIAVNNGAGTAARLLQRALKEAGNPGLAVDGFIGAATLAAARTGGAAGLRRLLLERSGYYRDIVTAHPADEKFLKGWLDRNNDLAALTGINFHALA